ncbi:hypothetical protein MVEN_00120500 [Mycena venus]|uniref:Uncharacterized protein n=1 Tax=Mycena venus TaxID=2733690 RepID=A0A8H6Z594_9AGAR|nr:hypothetical protein MVEN_00120500 [Mycena venus]
MPRSALSLRVQTRRSGLLGMETGGVSVQTDNTAGEIDNFASPTFKSLPMWFPRVRSTVLDLIIEGKFEAEDLIKLSSHGFLLLVPLLGAWTTYTGIRALCDPTNGGVAAAFSIYTALLLQFSTQYEWSAVLHYHYEFTCIRLQENFRPTRWTIPDPSLMATCLIRYPLLPTSLLTAPSLPAKRRGLADRLSSPLPQTPTIRQKVNETCFNFNGADGCRMGDKCARNHICISCSGPHTNQACPNRK